MRIFCSEDMSIAAGKPKGSFQGIIPRSAFGHRHLAVSGTVGPSAPFCYFGPQL